MVALAFFPCSTGAHTQSAYCIVLCGGSGGGSCRVHDLLLCSTGAYSYCIHMHSPRCTVVVVLHDCMWW